MELRDYQQDCLKAVEENLNRGIHRQLVVLPTGAGKTVIFSHLIKEKKLKTLVIAHRIELLDQAMKKIKAVDPDISMGLFCGVDRYCDRQVTVASIQSATNDLDLLKEQGYELLIIDEAHHSAAKTYRQLIDHLGFNEKGLMVGFTATPQRGDKTRLDDIFQKIVFDVSIRKLVQKGYLVKPKGVHIQFGIDLRKIKKKLGEFDHDSLKQAMQTEEAMDIVISAVKKYAHNRHCIVFGVDIEHSEELSLAIQQAGFTCQAVHSKISPAERRQTLKNFEEGKLQFITNPMILTEGFDCPRADCMINASPTLNNSLYTQKAGRVLRTYPNKREALLIDFGRNSRKHSLCTVVSLFGQDAEIKAVKKPEELLFEMPKIKPKTPTIGTEESDYNPIDISLKIADQTSQQKQRQHEKPESPLTDADLCHPENWPIEDRYISEKQVALLQKLARQTNTFIPRKNYLEEMGIRFASKVIEYLIAKKDRLREAEPITEPQVNYLRMLANRREIDMDGQDIYSLTKYEAKSIIGRHQQSMA